MANYVEGSTAKFIPDYPYYAYINFKLGDLDLSPIPPKYIQSFSAELSVNSNTMPTATLTVFDETAILIEAKLSELQVAASNANLNRKDLIVSWGYVNGPQSKVYAYTWKESTLSFSNDGSATLTIEMQAATTVERQLAKAYVDSEDEGKPIEEILHELAAEAGWRIVADSIEPIEDVFEESFTLDNTTYNTVEKKVRKRFLRFNKTPTRFIVEDIAPYCISKEGHMSGYTLWFDCPLSNERNGLSPSSANVLSSLDLGNTLEELGKNVLFDLLQLPLDSSKLTNTLLTELIRETAANTIIEGVLEVIQGINASGGLGSFISNLVISKITSYLNSVISNFASNLTSALSSSISGAIGGQIGSQIGGSLANFATNMITSSVNQLINSIYGSIVTCIKGHLQEVTDNDKIDEFFSKEPGSLSIKMDDPNHPSVLTAGLNGADPGDIFGRAFKSAADQLGKQLTAAIDDGLSKVVGEVARTEALRQNSNMPIMYFKPPLLWKNRSKSGEDFTAGIPDMYRFEYGVGVNSNVIEVSISYKGSQLATGNQVSTSVINKATGLLERAGYDKSTNPYYVEMTGDNIPTERSVFRLQSSSGDIDTLNHLAAYLWAKGRIVQQSTGTITIIGDPRVEAQNICSLLILTKFGQVFHRSGIYKIDKVSHNIQGGLYTTTLTVSGGNSDKDNNGILASLGKEVADSGVPSNNQTTRAYRSNNGNVDGAVSWALSRINDGQAIQNDATLVSNAFQLGGGFDIKSTTTSNDAIKKLTAAGFQSINYPGADKLQKGDVLESNGRMAIYLGNGEIAITENGQTKRMKLSECNISWNRVLRPSEGSLSNVTTPNTVSNTFLATSYAPSRSGNAMEGGYDVGWGISNFFEGKNQANHYIAVDPSLIPYGTVVYITFPSEYSIYTGEYLAVDCGSSIRGNHIDVYVGNQEDGVNPDQFSINVQLQMTGKSVSLSQAGSWRPGWNG